MSFATILETIDGWVWGPVMLVILVGTGIFLTPAHQIPALAQPGLRHQEHPVQGGPHHPSGHRRRLPLRLPVHRPGRHHRHRQHCRRGLRPWPPAAPVPWSGCGSPPPSASRPSSPSAPGRQVPDHQRQAGDAGRPHGVRRGGHPCRLRRQVQRAWARCWVSCSPSSPWWPPSASAT